MIEHARLVREGRGDEAPQLAPPPARFPSSPETRRAILEAVAKKNEKYARPFEHGDVAIVSLIGTESWSDYGAVVLQMAMLDTLMSIVAKLGELLDRPGERPV
jgi:hypothetical protein